MPLDRRCGCAYVSVHPQFDVQIVPGVLHRFRYIASRRWNPRVAAQRLVAGTVVASVVGFVGLMVAPFVVVGYVAYRLLDGLRRSFVWVRGFVRQGDEGAQPAAGVGARFGGVRASVLPGARRVRREPGAGRGSERMLPTVMAADRRVGTLVAEGRRRAERAEGEVREKDATHPPRLTAEDFQRSIIAMVRHHWQGRDALRQIEGLGARWVWAQAGESVARVRGSEPGVRGTAAQQEICLAYHHGDRWGTWVRAPDIEITLYLDAEGRLIGGRAWPRKLRM